MDMSGMDHGGSSTDGGAACKISVSQDRGAPIDAASITDHDDLHPPYHHDPIALDAVELEHRKLLLHFVDLARPIQGRFRWIMYRRHLPCHPPRRSQAIAKGLRS